MTADEVLRVLEALERAGIRVGITGGWGVDALLGRQTREHADVDLGLAASDVDRAVSALTSVGYRVVGDQRPARLDLRSEAGKVDLHPIEWDAAGRGVQAGFDGEVFEYPPGSLEARGLIAGQSVPCATPELQLEFHLGYEPSDLDRMDVGALGHEFGFPLPPPFA